MQYLLDSSELHSIPLNYTYGEGTVPGSAAFFKMRERHVHITTDEVESSAASLRQAADTHHVALRDPKDPELFSLLVNAAHESGHALIDGLNSSFASKLNTSVVSHMAAKAYLAQHPGRFGYAQPLTAHEILAATQEFGESLRMKPEQIQLEPSSDQAWYQAVQTQRSAKMDAYRTTLLNARDKSLAGETTARRKRQIKIAAGLTAVALLGAAGAGTMTHLQETPAPSPAPAEARTQAPPSMTPEQLLQDAVSHSSLKVTGVDPASSAPAKFGTSKLTVLPPPSSAKLPSSGKPLNK